MSQAGSSSQPRGKGKATKRTSGELTPVTTDETNKRSKAEGKKRALNTMREEQAYENGVIRKIVVENFMNHGHMQIDLDPHVNFIVGKNGSGKSAIVASCIAGLACKASATGRNLSSYKHFIKHGCDYALIQIHLANGGHDPYKYEEFGDTVIVEHRIEKTGGGAYRLKSADGGVDRKVAKREVEELNQHYNIQADNPCSLLTQEAAKKFLHNGNESDRYRFFLMAANLGTQKEDLMHVQANLQVQEEKTEKAKESIPRFEEMARVAKEEHDGAVNLKRLEEQKETMEPMVAWAQVASKEREMRLLTEEARQADEGVDKVQEKLDALLSELASLEERKNGVDAELHQLHAEFERRQSDAVRAQQHAKEPQKAMKAAARNLEAATADRAENESSLEVAKDTLANLESTLEDRQQALAAEREKKRRDFEEQMARSKEEGEKRNRQVQALKAETERLTEAKKGSAEAAAAAKERLQHEGQELKEMSSKSLNTLRNIHPNLPELVEKIKKARFQGPVVGPLGAHVKLNKGYEGLALAAECALRGPQGLSAFVVTNKPDEALLRKLAQSLPPPPRTMGGDNFNLASRLSVMIRPAEARFAVPEQRRMVCEHATLLDALNIEDDTMHNYFIDKFDGGQILLFKDRQTAVEVMHEQPRPKNAPPLLVGVMEDQQAFVYTSHQGGTQGHDHRGYKARGLLMADQKARKSLLEQQLEQRRQEVGEAERQVKASDEQLKQTVADEKKLRKELKHFSDAYRAANAGLKELDQSEEADEALADLETARRDVDDFTGKVAHAAASEEQFRQEHARAEAEYGPRKAAFAQAKQAVIEAKEVYEAKYQAAQEFDAPIRQRGAKKRKLQGELDAAKEGGDKKRKEADDIQKYIDKFSPLVEKEFGARIDDPQERSTP